MDVAPIETGGSPPLEASPDTSRPRFCRKCGTPLVPETAECPACPQAAGAQLQGLRDAAARPETSHGSLRSALALYFALLLTSLVAVAAGDHGAAGQLTEAAVDSLIILGWAAASWRAVLPGLAKPSRPLWLLAGMGLAFPTFALASVLVEAMTDLVGAQALEYTAPFLDAGHASWVIILAICVQPAVGEEIAFRGVILSGLGGSLRGREALVVSALLFMTLHLAVLSFPHLFVLGLVLGWLRLASGSLYPSMALHFTHNLLCVVSELAFS